MRDDTERLRDILEAIERVEKYARQGKTVFEQQELMALRYLVWFDRGHKSTKSLSGKEFN